MKRVKRLLFKLLFKDVFLYLLYVKEEMVKRSRDISVSTKKCGDYETAYFTQGLACGLETVVDDLQKIFGV